AVVGVLANNLHARSYGILSERLSRTQIGIQQNRPYENPAFLNPEKCGMPTYSHATKQQSYFGSLIL
ncbi:MAG: hypothetical protein KDC61_18850, partial [Saprospiraceae bacterium]|nr:hypothetical protein [Saprospiraceae bacterium]